MPNAYRARAGIAVSWNDETRASGRLSQFQPPSGHWKSISRSTQLGGPLVREPRQSADQIALPSCDAQRRTRSG